LFGNLKFTSNATTGCSGTLLSSAWSVDYSITRFEVVFMRLLRLWAVFALVLTGARLYAASPVAAKGEIPSFFKTQAMS